MKIFVSYSSKSKTHIETLINDLKSLDHEVWYDQHLSGGDVWWDKILDQIRNCDIFIFTQSSYTVASEACILELEYAKDLNRSILPVILEGEFAQYETPRIISELQYLDYRKKDKTAVFKLNSALKKLPLNIDLPDPLPPKPSIPRISKTFQPAYQQKNEVREVTFTPKTQNNPNLAIPALWILFSLYLGFFGWFSAQVNQAIDESMDFLDVEEPVSFGTNEYQNPAELQIELEQERLGALYPTRQPADRVLALLILAFFFGATGQQLAILQKMLLDPSLNSYQSLLIATISGGLAGIAILVVYYGVALAYEVIDDVPDATVLLFLCLLGGYTKEIRVKKASDPIH